MRLQALKLCLKVLVLVDVEPVVCVWGVQVHHQAVFLFPLAVPLSWTQTVLLAVDDEVTHPRVETLLLVHRESVGWLVHVIPVFALLHEVRYAQQSATVQGLVNAVEGAYLFDVFVGQQTVPVLAEANVVDTSKHDENPDYRVGERQLAVDEPEGPEV